MYAFCGTCGKMLTRPRPRSLRCSVAAKLGTSQTMYARYERGANELPIHHLITLSKYYGVSTDYLLGLSKER